MTDDGIKITLRMGTEELQALEDFMGERDLENKSVFIREAIKRYMETYDSPAGQRHTTPLPDRCPRRAGSSSASATSTWMHSTSWFSAECA